MTGNMLKISGLNKKYGDKHVLKDLSLDVHSSEGSLVGIVGINGAGKSTLLRILAQIDGDYDGQFTLHVNGQDINSKFDVGFLPEERSLPSSGKVVDILKLWLELRGKKGEECKVLIEKWLVKAELEQYRNTKLKSLSKGNKQKLQLACCLMHEPIFIVFDEPFSGLDPGNQELVINLLQERKQKGALIVLSAHQLELVERMCDQTFLMDDGRLEQFDVAHSNPGKLMSVRLHTTSPELDFLKHFESDNNVFSVPENEVTAEQKASLFDAWCRQDIQVYYGKFMNLREHYIHATVIKERSHG
ncbi:ABC transporter ATP-binding protein [Alteromonas halophila]|uniref:ABC transporter domain-containing protein n=1 Tax=Alteromonas halophila TaxID=516698 RepID=A0A918JMN3_9ALTE|nr:ATP-binding cassette domain-containing protein [Alteromonas halophila]GGW83900.1 hypothetical protein GCM10007391_16890 [Alteromonas halophila]